MKDAILLHRTDGMPLPIEFAQRFAKDDPSTIAVMEFLMSQLIDEQWQKAKDDVYGSSILVWLPCPKPRRYKTETMTQLYEYLLSRKCDFTFHEPEYDQILRPNCFHRNMLQLAVDAGHIGFVQHAIHNVNKPMAKQMEHLRKESDQYGFNLPEIMIHAFHAPDNIEAMKKFDQEIEIPMGMDEATAALLVTPVPYRYHSAVLDHLLATDRQFWHPAELKTEQHPAELRVHPGNSRLLECADCMAVFRKHRIMFPEDPEATEDDVLINQTGDWLDEPARPGETDSEDEDEGEAELFTEPLLAGTVHARANEELEREERLEEIKEEGDGTLTHVA